MSDPLGQERMEVAASVVLKDDRFAVDQGMVRTEAANRLGDPLKTIREVRASPAPEKDAYALLASQDAESVVLDLVQPVGASGRAIDENGLARTDEAGRRIASPEERWRAPRDRFRHLPDVASRHPPPNPLLFWPLPSAVFPAHKRHHTGLSQAAPIAGRETSVARRSLASQDRLKREERG
jgi:hypothetical protein